MFLWARTWIEGWTKRCLQAYLSRAVSGSEHSEREEQVLSGFFIFLSSQ